MLRALLYPAFDQKDTLMYKHLITHAPFQGTTDLEHAMKTCTIKEKRFHSIHLYAKLMCQDYTPITPPRPESFKHVMMAFDEVLCRFNAFGKEFNFFSYPWLTRKLLNISGEHRYDLFIKQIRCKKRNLHYEDMFANIVTASPPTYLIRVWGMSKWGCVL
jgi:hypothetical protein